MKKQELITFCKNSSLKDVLEKAKYDAFSLVDGQFTLVGGKVILMENGEKIIVGEYPIAVSKAEKVFKER